jgi:hypothetical protein
MQENSLTIFERGNQLLAEANTVQKAKELKDLALTAADWAKHKGLGEEAVKLAMSYAMDASRRMGELLQATERADKETRYGSTRQEQPQKTTKTPTLQELGITRKESSRAQKIAALPQETFDKVKAGVVPVSKAIKAATSAAHPKKRIKVGPPADAMNFVENAILALEQIKPNDAQRKEAWAYLRRWLNEHE